MFTILNTHNKYIPAAILYTSDGLVMNAGCLSRRNGVRFACVCGVCVCVCVLRRRRRWRSRSCCINQARLHDRGAAEMVLQTISASKGELFKELPELDVFSPLEVNTRAESWTLTVFFIWKGNAQYILDLVKCGLM